MIIYIPLDYPIMGLFFARRFEVMLQRNAQKN